VPLGCQKLELAILTYFIWTSDRVNDLFQDRIIQ
jgi:hypothetical protein